MNPAEAPVARGSSKPIPTGPSDLSTHPKRPLIILVVIIAVLISGVRRVGAIYPVLSGCRSVEGYTALFWYLGGNYVNAAQHYRAHYAVAGSLPDESSAPDYVMLVSDDLRLAEQEAHRLLLEDPDAVGPRLTLADISLRHGEPAQALAWCDEAIAHEPDQFDAEILASIAQAQLGDEGDAIRRLHLALRHDRTETRLTTLLTALQATGELAKRPRATRPWCLLAQYYRYLRTVDRANGQQAIRYAKQAINRNDHPADAWLAMGIVYDKREQRRKALEALQRAIVLDPAHAEALRWAGRVYGKYGDVLQEYQMMERARLAAPDDPFYVEAVSYVLTEKLGDYYRALRLALETLVQHPSDPKATWRVAWDYEVLGDYARAEMFYQEAIRLDPDNAKLWSALGDVLRSAGRTSDALRAYEEAASLSPRWFEPIRRIGGLYHDLRRYPEAIDAYSRALTLGDDDLDDLSSLCGLYHMTSQFQQAVDCFREVLRRDPRESRAQRLLPESLNNLRLQTSAR